jgi:two-component sensor histidine kinase
LGSCYGRLARHYFSDDYRPDSTLYYFALAEREYSQVNDPYDSWHLYVLRGELYFTMGDMEKSETDLLKALEMTRSRQKRMDYGVALYRLVRNYFAISDWEKYSNYAETYFQFLEEGDRAKNHTDYAHRGLYFFEDEQNGKEVLPVLNQIAIVHERLNHPLNAIDAYKYVAELEEKMGKREEAIAHLLHAAAIANRFHYMVDLQVSYHHIYSLYEAAGDTDQAFYYFKKFKTVEDSVEILDNIRYFHELEIKYETQKREEAFARQTLEMEKEQLSNHNLILIISLLSFLVMAAFGFLYGKSKSNKVLAFKNELIAKSLAEKELLLREIHHRVKNNLQVISSLLNLQSKSIQDSKAAQAIKEGRNRVNSMSLIHQNLYQHENLMGMDVGLYIEQLSKNLFESYTINPDRIKFITHVDSITLDVDTLIPLGLIVNELISNALKHAFPDDRQGILEVTIKEDGGNFHLEVSDNGIGMENLKPATFHTSFGMQMIEAFAQKLKAKLEIRNDHGFRVSLHIPKQAA